VVQLNGNYDFMQVDSCVSSVHVQEPGNLSQPRSNSRFCCVRAGFYALLRWQSRVPVGDSSAEYQTGNVAASERVGELSRSDEHGPQGLGLWLDHRSLRIISQRRMATGEVRCSTLRRCWLFRTSTTNGLASPMWLLTVFIRTVLSRAYRNGRVKATREALALCAPTILTGKETWCDGLTDHHTVRQVQTRVADRALPQVFGGQCNALVPTSPSSLVYLTQARRYRVYTEKIVPQGVTPKQRRRLGTTRFRTARPPL
jgi:hypothetical protein